MRRLTVEVYPVVQILLAKSEIPPPQVSQAVKNRKFPRTIRRENDFAISILSRPFLGHNKFGVRTSLWPVLS
jgi:hypothetical protein